MNEVSVGGDFAEQLSPFFSNRSMFS